MAELADALDSGSSGPQGHGGSSPLTRTIHTDYRSLDFQGFFCFCCLRIFFDQFVTILVEGENVAQTSPTDFWVALAAINVPNLSTDDIIYPFCLMLIWFGDIGHHKRLIRVLFRKKDDKD